MTITDYSVSSRILDLRKTVPPCLGETKPHPINIILFPDSAPNFCKLKLQIFEKEKSLGCQKMQMADFTKIPDSD